MNRNNMPTLTKSLLATAIPTVTLQQAGITVTIAARGCTLLSIRCPDKFGSSQNIIAGLPDPAAYEADDYYLGCVVGRYANRIGEGRFVLEGKTYQLPINNAPHHLHGGEEGLHTKIWAVKEQVETADRSLVVFEYLSPDGEGGYPGNLQLRVSYELSNNRLRITYEASTDKATPLNLTNHSYFNLSGFAEPTIHRHLLRIHANRYTEKGPSNLPTGKLLPVQGTPLDFSSLHPVGDHIDALVEDRGYDHNYVLENAGELQLAAELLEPGSGRTLKVYTDRPGIQLYTANWWDGTVTGEQGVLYGKHAALALETQAWPDSVNQPAFPGTILRPGETFRSVTDFEFGVCPDTH
ncbi:MAG: galactose mutarotase [Candidatus Pseudobacter hemicellulosilyticus]|uniref:Aldose 1-epimerase n=1 Tax=Candidatus Pseudobacter hemicellulosilyticus TaxID=3121375 RepID=A0AAJ5WPB9_9BACT|nr:MAG: galactose mutarotase [Pseudobacter sp.]